MDDKSQQDTDESSRKVASSLVHTRKGKQSVHDLWEPTARGGQRTRGNWSKSLCESVLRIRGPECCSSWQTCAQDKLKF